MDLNHLRQLIFDESLSPSTREHAYYNYWMHYTGNSDVLSRQDVSEMLRFTHWINPLGDIISHLCQHKQLNQDEVHWMKTQIPSDTFAYKQLLAFEIINDDNLGWHEKYMAVTKLKANWAVSQVLRTVPSAETEEAKLAITSLNLGKNTRRWQLDVLSKNNNSSS